MQTKLKKEEGIHRYLYGIDKDETEEQYIERRTRFTTFAVVKDGEWYERGKMGWWAGVSDEKDRTAWQDEFDKLVKGLTDDTLLTLVDYHI